MPSYRLSIEAAADLERIADHGVQTFGLTQSLKYHAALESRFDLLGDFPRIGTPTYDLRPGLYRYRYKAHMIFYAIEPEHVLNVRVLPARADFARQF